MNKVEIQNVQFHNFNMNEIIKIIESRVLQKNRTFIVTANPEIVMHANQDHDYLEVLRKADFIVPDGIGIVVASKLLKSPLKERVAGFDLMGKLLHLAEQKQLKVFLLGAKDTTVEKAYNNIMKKHPDLKIVGYHHGYIDINDEKLVNHIVELEPDMVFVALGFPKQEFWISKHIAKFNKGLFMGVGGSFDVWAGEVKRAPQIWINLNLEWLYRLIKQPTRFKRMLVLPQFLFRVIKYKK